MIALSKAGSVSIGKRLRRSGGGVGAVAVLAVVSALAPTAGRAAAGLSACTRLAIRNGGLSAASGHEVSRFGFVNRSSAACVLKGYARVRLLGAGGRPITTFDEDELPGTATYFGTIPAARTVTLTPRATAWFSILYFDPQFFTGANCQTSAAVRIAAPQAANAVTVTGSAAQIAAYGYWGSRLTCGVLDITPLSSRRF